MKIWLNSRDAKHLKIENLYLNSEFPGFVRVNLVAREESTSESRVVQASVIILFLGAEASL